jgi:hypothetical protein
VTAKKGLTTDGLFVRKTDKGEEVFKSKGWREHSRNKE